MHNNTAIRMEKPWHIRYWTMEMSRNKFIASADAGWKFPISQCRHQTWHVLMMLPLVSLVSQPSRVFITSNNSLIGEIIILLSKGSVNDNEMKRNLTFSEYLSARTLPISSLLSITINLLVQISVLNKLPSDLSMAETSLEIQGKIYVNKMIHFGNYG